MKNNGNADNANIIMPLSTTAGNIMNNNSATLSSPSSQTGMFKKLTMSIGSIIGVSSPSNSQNAAMIGSKTLGMMENDGDEESTSNKDDIAPPVGGKTSGMMADDFDNDDKSVASNGNDDDSKDRNYVPEVQL